MMIAFKIERKGCLFVSAVSFFILFILIQPVNVLADSPIGLNAQVSNDSVSDSDEVSREELLTQFLFNLYNQLIDQGHIQELPLKHSWNVWSVNYSTFLRGIQNFDESGGGFLANGRLYHSEQYPLIQYGGDDENDLFASFRNPDQTFSIGKRSGRPANSCEVTSVDSDTANLALAITSNLECMYVQYLSVEYRSLSVPRPPFNRDYILNHSGIQDELASYMEGLVAEGLVVRYSIDLDNDEVTFDVFQGADGLKHITFELLPSSVNVLTPIEEAGIFEESYHEMSMTEFLYFDLELIPSGRPVSFSREVLTAAFSQVVELGGQASANEKKEILLNAFGIANSGGRLDSDAANSACPQFQGNTYFSVVNTPHNKCMTYIRGLDRGGVLTDPRGNSSSGLEQMAQQFASNYGYTLKSFLHGKGNYTYQNIITALKEAASVFIDAHGQSTGAFDAICLPDTEYGTKACCRKIKEIARMLGIREAEQMECSARVTQDPTGTVISFSSGTYDGCVVGSGPANRCMIRFGNTIYGYLGKKALVVTSQCYGGACGGDLGNIGNNVIDYVSGYTSSINFPRLFRHDFPMLGRDALGQSQQYLMCIDYSPVPPTGPYCTNPPSRDAVVGSELRVIQTSIEVRGSDNGDPDNVDACIPQFGAGTGYEAYCSTYSGGDPEHRIELAPVIAGVEYLPEFGLFNGLFSSQVKHHVGTVEFQEGTCKPRTRRGTVWEGSVTSGAAWLGVAGYPLMNETAWFSDPRTMRLRYGVDQFDWRWYAKVIVRGVESYPAGIKLDGNGSAGQKWIWPKPDSDVSPWANLSGVASNGDSAEFWLPCEQPIQCCFPVLRAVATSDGNHRWEATGGCTCGSAGSIQTAPVPDFPYSGCYSIAPDGDNAGETFPGTPHVGAECCDRAPALPGEPPNSGICDAYVTSTHECPPDPMCPDHPIPPAVDITYQFRDWPMDDSGDQQCPTVRGSCAECRER